GLARFRVNLYSQRESLAAAFRMIPATLKTLEELGMPTSLYDLTLNPRGLVLVTGPTGSGKSTTLAALIDHINSTRAEHIITIEDPIEFLHKHKRCIVNQRELGEDATSFADALRGALRQDPDVILLGEMRDLETISTALTAAETGHLVFGTLHTQSAPSTVDRVIDVFPAEQQDQIRIQLAATLVGVLTQTLLPTADGRGRAPGIELLLPDDAVRNLIRQSKVEQVYSIMQTSISRGMQTMEQSLVDLVRRGVVTKQVALQRSSRPDQLVGLLERSGFKEGEAGATPGLRVAGSTR
nr:PilT/PilU family type 4a pilus ATPase [Actinomycetota bacterium]